jgi:N-acetylneuraminic acid mutarotase
MRKILLLSAFLLAVFLLNAQTWVQKNDFPGTERYAATGFAIDSKLYFGTGYNGVTFFNDWWEYDPSTDQWTQKANYPGQGRLHAVSFVIGNKGYLLFGSTTVGIYTFPKDVWEYDPIADQWTQKSNFPGSGRYTAVGIEINGKGYVGTGWKQVNPASLNDWWEYNPVNDSWTQKANFGGGIRRAAMAFSINNKGFVGLGEGSTNSIYKDLWEYNPLTNSWIQKSDFIFHARVAGASFTLGNYGYVGSGVNGEFGNLFFTDYYKIDPILNNWSYAGGFYPPRFGMTSISNGNCAYILTGKIDEPTIVPSPQNTLQDFWEFCPLSALINANDTMFICPGNCVILNANPGGCFNYQWQINGIDIPGANSINYTATTNGVYTVIVSNNFESMLSNSITVIANPLPASPGPITGPTIVCDQTVYTYSVNPVAGATGYFWTISSQGQIISGQGTNTVNVMFYGSAVKISVSAVNDCGIGKKTAIKLIVDNCHENNKIKELEEDVKINIYPNPSTGEFYGYLNDFNDNNNNNYYLVILNNKGQTINYIEGLYAHETFIFGKDLEPGVYFIRVISNGKIYSHKFIKN